jgi:hypothetical protein
MSKTPLRQSSLRHTGLTLRRLACLDHCSNHTATLPLRKPAALYRYILSRVTYRLVVRLRLVATKRYFIA